MTDHEIYITKGGSLFQNLQLCRGDKFLWQDLFSRLVEIAYPNALKTVHYRDSDGDLITLSNSGDYQEAVKDAQKNCGKIVIYVEVEGSSAEDLFPFSAHMPKSTSEASVSTGESMTSDMVDIASLKKEIIDSVLLEIRKSEASSSSCKSASLRRCGANIREFHCVACKNKIDSKGFPYYKCANCKWVFLCESCEVKNDHSHAETGHVFLKLRGPIKKQFFNKALLKQNITSDTSRCLQQIASKETGTTNLIELDYVIEPDNTVQNQRDCIPVPDFHSREAEPEVPPQLLADPCVEDSDEDGFLFVPMPACFDLNKPMAPVILPDSSGLDQQPMSVVEKSDKESQASVSCLEAAVQLDLKCLADSMSDARPDGLATTPSTAETVTIASLSPQPSIVPQSSLSFVLRQVASVNDSTPARISLMPRPPMDQLIEMGFGNRRLNVELLDRYHGNVEQVVADLIARENGLLQWSS